MLERIRKPSRKGRPWRKCAAWVAVSLLLAIPCDVLHPQHKASVKPASIRIELLKWADAANLEPSPTLRLFKQGVEAYSKKQYDSAINLLPNEQEARSTGVADYVQLYRAKANLMLGRDREALEGFRSLKSQFPDSPLIPEALFGECQALLKLQDAISALTVTGDPRFPNNADALYYKARARELAGQKEKAVELYLQYYAEHPKASYEALAQQNLLALAPSALRGKHSYPFRLQRAEKLLQANDASGARQLLLALKPVSSPDTSSAQKRRLLLAEAEYRLGHTSEALTQLKAILPSDPATHARVLRMQGSCYRRLKREDDLVVTRDKALKSYPRSADTEELCYSVATYFDVDFEYAKARQAYRLLYERFPNGRYSERAAWKIALFHYLAKEYTDAAAEFWRYLRNYPKPASSIPAMYWLGRCYEKLGGSENARYLYRRVQELAGNSYFGSCARDSESSLPGPRNPGTVSLAGIVFDQVMSFCDALQLAAPSLSELSQAAQPVIERARVLWVAGLPELAISEIRWASRRFPAEERSLSLLIAQIYASAQDHYRAISTLRNTLPDYASMPFESLPNEVWRLLLPLSYWDIIAGQADKNQLDPHLVLGLIRQESSFNPDARSPANARGLMQILPSTGLHLARQAGLQRYGAQALFHPETNILLGTLYLADLVRRYGKMELALAAYNAGSTRVDRWIREFGDADMPEFVERIPFSETRNYIKQVLSNRALYALLVRSEAVGVR